MAGNRRNPKLVLVGLLCLLIGGSLVAWRSVDTSTTVLVTSHDIAAGEWLAGADVTVVKVRLKSGVTALPSDQPLTGLVALVDLPAGTLLVTGDIGQPAPPATDQVMAPVVVASGMAPIWALHGASPITICGKTGEPVNGVVASEPVALGDGLSFSFDVWVSIEDAILLAGWVAEGSLVVASP